MAAGAARSTPRRRRLTQQEQSAATRKALIDSAIETLIELGYERTTTTEVSERALLSRGAHLHHFQTRSALLSAAVEALAERGLDDVSRAVRRLPEGEGRDKAALEMIWRLFRGPLFQTMLELSVHARTDPELRALLDPIENLLGTESITWGRVAFGDGPDDASVDELVSVVMTMVRGVAVMSLLEPRRRVSVLWANSRAVLLDLLERHAAGEFALPAGR